MHKKILSLLFLISAINLSIGQKNVKSKPEILRLNGKKMPFVRAGLTNLYACKFEVTNFEYVNFLDWTRKTKGETDYQLNLPDTMSWRSTRM